MQSDVTIKVIPLVLLIIFFPTPFLFIFNIFARLINTGFLLAAGCAGWGGLSVICQTAALLDGTDLPLAPCLLGKLTHGQLSALLAALVSFWLF